jgi:CPA1 family monovalent cation:H+ antiporter
MIDEASESNDNSLDDFRNDYLQLLEHQRKLLQDMNGLSEFDEELIRKYLSLIDLEEFKIREKLLTIMPSDMTTISNRNIFRFSW